MTIDIRVLKKKMMPLFSLKELTLLASRIEVDWDEIDETKKEPSLAYFLAYVERRGKVEELLKWCREERPSEDWNITGETHE